MLKNTYTRETSENRKHLSYYLYEGNILPRKTIAPTYNLHDGKVLPGIKYPCTSHDTSVASSRETGTPSYNLQEGSWGSNSSVCYMISVRHSKKTENPFELATRVKRPTPPLPRESNSVPSLNTCTTETSSWETESLLY